MNKQEKRKHNLTKTADEATKEVLSGKYLKVIKGFNYAIMRNVKRI